MVLRRSNPHTVCWEGEGEERGKEGGREERREGERKGGRSKERRRKRGREGGRSKERRRERGKEGGRSKERRRERGREGGRSKERKRVVKRKVGGRWNEGVEDRKEETERREVGEERVRLTACRKDSREVAITIWWSDSMATYLESKTDLSGNEFFFKCEGDRVSFLFALFISLHFTIHYLSVCVHVCVHEYLRVHMCGVCNATYLLFDYHTFSLQSSSAL